MYRSLTDDPADTVAGRLEHLRQTIADVAARAGRQPDEIALVAVTKTVPLDRIREAYAAGQRVFGENKVQEGEAKLEGLADEMPDAEWHLIGHLQTNKVKHAIRSFDLVQSVDSERLGTRLDEQAAQAQRRMPVLLQVNVAHEASKSGFTVDELRDAFVRLVGLSHLEIRGLMTIAPLVTDPEEVRWVFQALRRLRDELQGQRQLESFRQLSMGMSGDFKVAIEEGATMVRVGRAVFGERPIVQGAVER